ncbi:MAG TPA: MBL fold metallo-hydrolase [Chitinophagaceae bacterium]|jgi:phosphoribosyl 1,2-cyclic phosphodiesterase|nr:MBL fold metallo-hydrolase [Chitinophagaceae bacterium]
MSLFISSLNSGSNGNCYYFGNKEEAVLIDAGISCREIEKRMKLLSLDPASLKAIFITHEHIDHISGLPTLVKKYRLPVYITASTYRRTGFLFAKELIQPLTPFEPIQIGMLSITAFPKWHDAVDPHSVVITCNGVTAGVFTDIGEPCKNVIHYFKQCHAAFLETNYDDDMLANGRYPVFLKNRISGKQGHLSNAQALQLFIAYRPSFMSHILLSHLSKENNSPALAEALFNKHAGNVTIVHAPRDKATAVYHITVVAGSVPLLPLSPVENKKTGKAKSQLSLF